MSYRIALMFQDGNLVGREYFHALREVGREPELVAAVGRVSANDEAIQRERTAGKWAPPPLPDDLPVARFESLHDPALRQRLRDEAIDVAIQGGIGILKPEMLSVPTIGFVNVHPGRLPDYRGCCCPEWAIYNGDTVYATAHLIDEGIDSGPVICAGRYEIDPRWDYEDFRANIYRHCARVLVEALAILDSVAPDEVTRVLHAQDETKACYRKVIGPAQLEAVKRHFPVAGRNDAAPAGGEK